MGKRIARPAEVKRWCVAKMAAMGVKGDGRSFWCYSDEEIAWHLKLTPKVGPKKAAQRLLDAAFVADRTSPITKHVYQKAAQKPGRAVVSKSSEVDFLQTYEWRRLRMEALRKYGPVCQCCGASPKTGAVMNVDHIKPRKLFPQLALDITNLQILCGECNHGKGNWDMTDWREKESV